MLLHDTEDNNCHFPEGFHAFTYPGSFRAFTRSKDVCRQCCRSRSPEKTQAEKEAVGIDAGEAIKVEAVEEVPRSHELGRRLWGYMQARL